MRYLIDTHILIWLMLEPKKLSTRATAILKNINNTLYISKISLWEIAIKTKIGKLDIKIEFKEIFNILKKHDLILMSLENEHIIQTLNLPMHHRDPFDRMLIAQAQIENLTIITNDGSFVKYEVDILM